jgi:hypothetical protein
MCQSCEITSLCGNRTVNCHGFGIFPIEKVKSIGLEGNQGKNGDGIEEEGNGTSLEVTLIIKKRTQSICN